MPTFKCPQCRGDFQAEAEGRYHCPHCDNTIAIHLHVHGKIPWETWREVGRLRAFWETWKQAMTNPVAFFRRVPKQGNFVLPMYYGMICQAIAIILAWSFQAGFHSIPSVINYMATFGGYGPFTYNFGWPAVSVFFVALVVVAPIFAVIGLFFTTANYHICLRVFGGSHQGFEGTFRAISYGSSAQLLCIIPIVGVIVAGIWSLVLDVIGIKEIHQTTYARAILAIVLPILVCCGFILLVVAVLFGAAIGAWVGGTGA